MRIRRITAAIIDIIILAFALAAMLSFIPLSKSIKDNYAKIDAIEGNVQKYSELTSEQLEEINKISYETEHEFIKYYLIFSLVLIIYFILIPMYRKDQTIGQKIMKIRLTNDTKVTANIYVIRALLNSGLCLLLICPLLLYILNRVWYSRVTSVLIFIQFTYWFINFIMLILIKETIHDKITKTKIIEVKR